MRRLLILTCFLVTSCGDTKEKLFRTLYHKTFVAREDISIEFIDSTHYITHGGRLDATKASWAIENRLTGTYLILDSYDMKVESISDSVINFSKGEFNPRLVLKN